MRTTRATVSAITAILLAVVVTASIGRGLQFARRQLRSVPLEGRPGS